MTFGREKIEAKKRVSFFVLIVVNFVVQGSVLSLLSVTSRVSADDAVAGGCAHILFQVFVAMIAVEEVTVIHLAYC